MFIEISLPDRDIAACVSNFVIQLVEVTKNFAILKRIKYDRVDMHMHRCIAQICYHHMTFTLGL